MLAKEFDGLMLWLDLILCQDAASEILIGFGTGGYSKISSMMAPPRAGWLRVDDCAWVSKHSKYCQAIGTEAGFYTLICWGFGQRNMRNGNGRQHSIYIYVCMYV